MQSKEVQSLAWQNSRQVLINIWRHGLRSMSVLVAWTLLCQQLKGVQIRQYQEMVSELMGVYREHSFVHELNSEIPEANVAKLPVEIPPFFQTRPRDLGKKVHACSLRFPPWRGKLMVNIYKRGRGVLNRDSREVRVGYIQFDLLRILSFIACDITNS